MQAQSPNIFDEPATKLEDVCKITYIYALVDPRDDSVRYVGKSDDPRKRLLAHINDKNGTQKCRWIGSLLGDWMRPELLILQAVSNESHNQAERNWVAKFKSDLLVNSNAGGSGMLDPSPETRALMRKAKVGKSLSDEHKRKLSEALAGRKKPPRTEAHKTNLTISCIGKIITKQHKKKLASANMLRKPATKSGFKGVYHDKTRNNYQATIKKDGKLIHIGRFKTAEEAAFAWNKTAKKLGWPKEGLNLL